LRQNIIKVKNHNRQHALFEFLQLDLCLEGG
jgi:hypothetical protein